MQRNVNHVIKYAHLKLELFIKGNYIKITCQAVWPVTVILLGKVYMAGVVIYRSRWATPTYSWLAVGGRAINTLLMNNLRCNYNDIAIDLFLEQSSLCHLHLFLLLLWNTLCEWALWSTVPVAFILYIAYMPTAVVPIMWWNMAFRVSTGCQSVSDNVSPMAFLNELSFEKCKLYTLFKLFLSSEICLLPEWNPWNMLCN